MGSQGQWNPHFNYAKKNEEALELRQGWRFLARALAGVGGLYEIAIKTISPFLRDEKVVGKAIRKRGFGTRASNLAQKQKHGLYLTTITLSDI